MEDIYSIHQQGKKIAAYAYITEEIAEQDEIRLQNSRKMESMFSLFSAWEYRIHSQCVIKAWNGYDISKENNETYETMVYVTEHGKVYHKNRGCNYLVLSIQQIALSQIDEKRNKSGECYDACESCNNQSFVTLVYITDYGNKYHTTTKCQGLKRSVKSIPFSQAEGMELCKKCGRNNHDS